VDEKSDAAARESAAHSDLGVDSKGQIRLVFEGQLMHPLLAAGIQFVLEDHTDTGVAFSGRKLPESRRHWSGQSNSGNIDAGRNDWQIQIALKRSRKSLRLSRAIQRPFGSGYLPSAGRAAM
jgi:hypothetical protein